MTIQLKRSFAAGLPMWLANAPIRLSAAPFVVRGQFPSAIAIELQLYPTEGSSADSLVFAIGHIANGEPFDSLIDAIKCIDLSIEQLDGEVAVMVDKALANVVRIADLITPEEEEPEIVMDEYTTFALRIILHMADRTPDGRPGTEDVVDEIEKHFRDDAKLEQRVGINFDGAEGVLEQLEANGYIYLREYDLAITPDGQAAFEALGVEDKAVLTDKFLGVHKTGLRLIAEAIQLTPVKDGIYRSHAFGLLKQWLKGEEAAVHAVAADLMNDLIAMHLIVVDRYTLCRLTRLGEFALTLSV